MGNACDVVGFLVGTITNVHLRLQRQTRRPSVGIRGKVTLRPWRALQRFMWTQRRPQIRTTSWQIYHQSLARARARLVVLEVELLRAGDKMKQGLDQHGVS